MLCGSLWAQSLQSITNAQKVSDPGTIVFTPAAGAVSNPTTVTFSGAATGSIYCSTQNGTTPATNLLGTGCTTGSLGNTTSITSAVTVKVVSGLLGDLDSPVASAAYTISGGVTWTLIQHPSNLTCTTTACNVTITALTAGNSALVLTGDFTGGSTSTISSVTLSGETFTHCPAQLADQTTGAGSHMLADCYYLLSAAGGGGTTVAVTWGIKANVDVQVLEIHRSTGTAALDTCTGTCTAALAACTSCTGPTPNVTATDFVAAWNTNENDCTAVASPFNTAPSPNVDNSNLFGLYSWSLSQSSANAAVYTCTSGKAAASTFMLK